MRKYIDKPIDPQTVEILQKKGDEVNAAGNLHIQLVTNEPRAFKGKMAYGTFSGVSNYFAMVGTKADDLSERVGYYGERLVLLAQTLGLNTCWVGLTYNNIKEAYERGEGEKLCCMIALGYGNDPGRNIKRKRVEDVSRGAESAPEWFRQGVEAAILAPRPSISRSSALRTWAPTLRAFTACVPNASSPSSATPTWTSASPNSTSKSVLARNTSSGHSRMAK